MYGALLSVSAALIALFIITGTGRRIICLRLVSIITPCYALVRNTPGVYILHEICSILVEQASKQINK